MIRGPSYGDRPASFSVDSSASGSFQDGLLSWDLHDGELRLGGGDGWKLNELTGSLGTGGWKLATGLVSNQDGAQIRIRPVPQASQTQELVAQVEARKIKLGLQSGIKNTVNPVKQVAIDAKGTFTARFPELHRFRFLGSFQLTGLEMSEWRMFELIASQTGDNRLQHLKTDWANGEIEWTPGLVRLNQIVFEESELMRMQGNVSIVGTELVGVVNLALPAPLVGRFPGGKPAGFSYPAAGWSWSQIRLTGTLDDWQEDLTQRLLGQIGPNVAVVSTNTTPADTDKNWTAQQLSPGQAETLERVFHKLLEK